MGFVKAIKAFDVDRGVKFSSFASTAIVREVRCTLRDNSGILRLTRNAFMLLVSIHKIERELGYMPTSSELSEMLGVEEDKIVKALTVGKPVKMFEEYIEQSEDDSSPLPFVELIADESPQAEDFICDREDWKDMFDALKEFYTSSELKAFYSYLQGDSWYCIARDSHTTTQKVKELVADIGKTIKEYNMLENLPT